jgi:hypothetical protein
MQSPQAEAGAREYLVQSKTGVRPVSQSGACRVPALLLVFAKSVLTYVLIIKKYFSVYANQNTPFMPIENRREKELKKFVNNRSLQMIKV